MNCSEYICPHYDIPVERRACPCCGQVFYCCPVCYRFRLCERCKARAYPRIAEALKRNTKDGNHD